MVEKNLVPKISKLREKAGLTQLELSQRVGVTENTIANWEKGRSGLEWIGKIIKLCEALDCSPEALVEYSPKSISDNNNVIGKESSSSLGRVRGIFKSNQIDEDESFSTYKNEDK